jgi:hypothetical protein
MTDTMEHTRAVVDAVQTFLTPMPSRPVVRRSARNPRDPEGNCTNDRHGKSKGAWNRGCRCPGAIAAHDTDVGNRRTHKPAQVDADGNCIAVRHDSFAAYAMAGCRCPAAVARRDEVRAAEKARRVARRLKAAKPAGRFRGPHTRVDRYNLRLLLSGFVDQPTNGERMAAVAILSQRGGRTGLYNTTEIGQRIGVTAGGARQIQLRIEKLRELRPMRRLADVEWKAVRVARAQERKAHRG